MKNDVGKATLLLIAFLSLTASLFFKTVPMEAAENESGAKESIYLNWWGPSRINTQNWKKVTDTDLDNIGLNEVSMYPPDTEPTPEQIKAADELVVNSFAAVLRHNWYDLKQAKKDGFVPYDDVHYINQDFVDDGRALDPDRPESLMFYPTENGIKLVGIMFLMPTNTEHGPQIGGPLTLWHFHLGRNPHCWFDYPDFVKRPDGSCLRNEPTRRSSEMLHVWLVDHPDGTFASDMTLPQKTREQLRCLSAPDG